MSMNIQRLKYILSVVLYGTIGMFLRYINLPSEVVVLCRGMIGSLVIILFMLIKGEKFRFDIIKKNLGWLLVSGVCLGLNWIFLFAAYLQTTVAIASLCNYLAPTIVVLIASLVFRERIKGTKLVCVAAALLGIVFVSGIFDATSKDVNFLGIGLGLSAAVCFVVLVICNRKIIGVSAYEKSVIQLAVSAFTVLPYVIISNWGTTLSFDTGSVLLTLMLGLVHTGFAYCLYFDGLSKLPVHAVAILGYIEPAVSVLCSAIILHESMGPFGWIGAALIIGAAAISELI